MTAPETVEINHGRTDRDLGAGGRISMGATSTRALPTGGEEGRGLGTMVSAAVTVETNNGRTGRDLKTAGEIGAETIGTRALLQGEMAAVPEIGLIITQALAVNVAKVYIVGRSPREARQRRRQVQQERRGAKSSPLTADVTNKSDVANLVKEISSREKCLCIPRQQRRRLQQLPHHYRVCFRFGDEAEPLRHGQDHHTRRPDRHPRHQRRQHVLHHPAFLPLLQASTERHHGWSGTVINISSISGLIKSAQHHFSYNASKAATAREV
ncbi:hypothetical protein B0T16DRAFT_450914 [Cercophora newfieldiana]|uniref:Uncharacterized protein n=1 Tax=Cercophora newfieldiana TaxID=92897 RepID=A0AA39YMA2_9PEZI|nr:hypothetical protein B0T16DRAFT_450914 [Cercophora newfieldiana]